MPGWSACCVIWRTTLTSGTWTSLGSTFTEYGTYVNGRRLGRLEELKAVLVHCPELDALTTHVRSFAQMLTERQGERLPQWLDAVHCDDLPSLHTLAAGVERDRDAVIAGLTLPWNCVVEGHVNRIKMLKRQMFGRAGFALLRKSCTDVCVIAVTGPLTGRVLIGNGDGYWGPNVSSATDFLDWYERWLNHMSAGCDNRALELTSPQLRAHPDRHRMAPKI